MNNDLMTNLAPYYGVIRALCVGACLVISAWSFVVEKTGVSDVQKRFGTRQWPGASQPRPQITSETPRASQRVSLAPRVKRVIDAFSTQRAKGEQCFNSPRDTSNALMRKGL